MTDTQFVALLKRLGSFSEREKRAVRAEIARRDDDFWIEQVFLHGPAVRARHQTIERGLWVALIVTYGLTLVGMIVLIAREQWVGRAFWSLAAALVAVPLKSILFFRRLSGAHVGLTHLLATLDAPGLVPLWLEALPGVEQEDSTSRDDRAASLERLVRHLPAWDQPLPEDARRRLAAELRAISRRVEKRQPLTGIEEQFLVAALLRIDLLTDLPRLEASVRTLAETGTSPLSERVRTAADEAIQTLRR